LANRPTFQEVRESRTVTKYNVDYLLYHDFILEEAIYYTIRLKADSDRDVLEYDERNNEFSSSRFRIRSESTDSYYRVP